jgi:hypothetical protein
VKSIPQLMFGKFVSTNAYRRITEQKEYEKHIRQWCWSDDIVAAFQADFHRSKDTTIAGNLSDYITASSSNTSSDIASIAGVAGRRMSLRKPEEFVKEDVLKQEGVMEWLRIQAPAIKYSQRLKIFSENKAWNSPEIWVCTGLQMVKNGNSYYGSERECLKSLKVNADASEFIAVPAGAVSAGFNIAWNKAVGSSTEYSFEGERIWAAQFMQLTVRYGTESDTYMTAKLDRDIPKVVTSYEVLEVPNLGHGGFRNDRVSSENSNSGAALKSVDLVLHVASDEAEEFHRTKPTAMELNPAPYQELLANISWNEYKTAVDWLTTPHKTDQDISKSIEELIS